ETFLAKAPPVLELRGAPSAAIGAVVHSTKQRKVSQRQTQHHQQRKSRTTAKQQQQTSGRNGENSFDYELLQQAMQYTAMLALDHEPADEQSHGASLPRQ